MPTPQPAVSKTAEHYQVFKFRLDPTAAQRARFEEEARAARRAYNTYLRHWYTAQENWLKRRDELVESGMDKADANAQTKREAKDNDLLKALSWQAFATQFATPTCRRHSPAAELRAKLEDPSLSDAERARLSAELETCWGGMGDTAPWAHLVHRRSLTTGLQNANNAIQRYQGSFSPKYTGRPVGKPRFKRPNAPKSISKRPSSARVRPARAGEIPRPRVLPTTATGSSRACRGDPDLHIKVSQYGLFVPRVPGRSQVLRGLPRKHPVCPARAGDSWLMMCSIWGMSTPWLQ